MADIFISSGIGNITSFIVAKLNIEVIDKGIGDVFVTPGHIRNLINTPIDDMQINSFITSAVVLIRARLGDAVVKTIIGLEIIRWLTAHFIALTDNTQRITREQIGDAEVMYSDIDSNVQFEIGLGGILSTRWGRVAAAMDQTGSLTKAGGPSIKMYAL